MKAIILSGGRSKRLKPLTEQTHKSLIEIFDGKTILDMELELLEKNGIKDIILVTGHFGEKIKEHINKRFPHLNVKFIHNKEYESTNCIYGLWLVRDHIDDNVLYFTGDIVLEDSVIKKLLNSKNENSIYVNKELTVIPGKDFKAQINEGVVKKIGVNISGEEVYSCLPILKMSKESMLIWLKETNKMVRAGIVNTYEMDSFNNKADEIQLKPEYMTDFCMEVDDLEDLAKAREFLKRRAN